MKRTTLLLGIAVITILSLMTGAYFYQRNEAAMRDVAENLFVQVLQEEVQRKDQDLKLYHLFAESPSDTLPLTIHIITSEGEKEYKLDTLKSKKNLSDNMKTRAMHSILCEKTPLLPDTLLGRWQSMLISHQIDATPTVQIAMTDFLERVTQLSSRGYTKDTSSFSLILIYYMGNRCEIEISARLAYTVQTVILYYWLPFLWIIIGLLAAIAVVFLYYRMALRPPKTKEVIREVIVEKEIFIDKEIQQVKLVGKVGKPPYQLSPTLFFDVQNKVLVHDQQNYSLSSQHCLILELFLDAPDYTVSDSQILKTVWDDDSNAIIDYFRSSGFRLSQKLRSFGFNIRFKRIKRDYYRMLLVDAPLDQEMP